MKDSALSIFIPLSHNAHYVTQFVTQSGFNLMMIWHLMVGQNIKQPTQRTN